MENRDTINTSKADKGKSTDISELIQLLFVGLIGANNEIERILKEFHEKHDKPVHGFLFSEYLLHRPLPIKEEGKNFCGQLNKTWELYPFINRLIRRSLVMVRPEDAYDENWQEEKWRELYKPSTDKDNAQANILIKMDETLFSQYLYKYWLLKNRKDENDLKEVKEKVEESKDRLEYVDLEEPENQFFVLAKKFVEDVEDIEKVNKDKNEISKKSFRVIRSLLLPQISHLKGKKIHFFIPIASNAVFYGVLFIYIPHFEWNKKDEKKIKQLMSDLITRLKKHYVSALAIIHEHFYEKLLYGEIERFSGQKSLTPQEKEQLFAKSFCLRLYDPKTGKDLTEEEPIQYEGFICRNRTCEICFVCDYFGWEESSDNVVEKYLHKLTQDRKIIGETKYIRESLIFRNRLYVDPYMLDILKDFLKPSKAKLKREGDLLPSILIEAPPGAGKDDIPNTLRFFTDCYDRGEIYYLNMASVKPNAIVPMTMVGGRFTWERSIYSKAEAEHERDGIPRDVELLGIFQQIRDRIHIEFQVFFSSVEDDGLISKANRYLLYLNNGIQKAIKGKRYKLTEQLRKKRECLIKVNNELDKWVGALLGKGEFENKIKELEVQQSLLELNEKKIEEKSKELDKVNCCEEQKVELNKQKEEIEKSKQAIEQNVERKDLLPIIDKKLEELKTLREEHKNELKMGINKFLEKLETGEKLVIKELFRKFPTIVLDELNSMDIESQGILLRFLEKSEIMPIGSYEDKMWIDGKAGDSYREFLTDFLIIGLMNEDPEEITRESAIRFLKQKDSYISGLLGDMLYEYILRIRRLRPDLRQRMMRNGELKLPELEKRRADIPSIFYMILDVMKKDFFQDSEVRISIDALEYLIMPDLKWNENVRLLQTLVKKVVEIVYEDYEERRYKKEKILTIKKEIIKKNEKTEEEIREIKKVELIIIREKHIKEAMKAIGMIKE